MLYILLYAYSQALPAVQVSDYTHLFAAYKTKMMIRDFKSVPPSLNFLTCNIQRINSFREQCAFFWFTNHEMLTLPVLLTIGKYQYFSCFTADLLNHACHCCCQTFCSSISDPRPTLTLFFHKGHLDMRLQFQLNTFIFALFTFSKSPELSTLMVLPAKSVLLTRDRV